MKGCFSIPEGIASPFTSLIFHSPFKTESFTSASFFCRTTTGRLDELQRYILSLPAFLYPFTCAKAFNTLFSVVISGHIIRVLAIPVSSRLPGFAFTSKLPIIRLHPLLPDTRPVAVSKAIKGRVLLSPGAIFEPLTSIIFHSPLIDDRGIAFSTERHEDIASAAPAMQIETNTFFILL